MSNTLQGNDIDKSLRNDVRLLGNILGKVLIDQEGRDIFDIVEKIRALTKDMRAVYKKELRDSLVNTVRSLNSEQIFKVARAFTVYFKLVNIAEQNHRIRRRREYKYISDVKDTEEGSLDNMFKLLDEKGIDQKELSGLMDRMSVELVFTAHPTQVDRQIVLEKFRHISGLVEKLDNAPPDTSQRGEIEEKIYAEVTGLWQTEEVPSYKITPVDEANSTLYYLRESIFDALTHVYRDFDKKLKEHYKRTDISVPSFLRFGSWVGGDRDGNPFVTHEVTSEVLEMHKALSLERYIKEVLYLKRQLSSSDKLVPVDRDLKESLAKDEKLLGTKPDVKNPREYYRAKLDYIHRKLLSTLENSGNSSSLKTQYNSKNQLLSDLRLIEKSLRNNKGDHLADSNLKDLIRKVDVFGFHLAKLDIRQNSTVHTQAINEITNRLGILNYMELDEEEKIEWLTMEIENPRPLIPEWLSLSEETVELIRTFKTVKKSLTQISPDCIDTYIISMSHRASHILEVLLLAKETGLYIEDRGDVTSKINIVPLFETIEDFKKAPGIMEKLYSHPVYRKHLEARGNLTEIMIGYSDSGKDGGLLSASWQIHKAQIELKKIADRHGLKNKFFHGRGGTVSRGGGPTNQAILARPSGTVDGRIKITEQGEVIYSNYSIPELAEDNITLVLSSVVLTSFKEERIEQKWTEVMEQISSYAWDFWKELVYDNTDFYSYFRKSTPISVIEQMGIGSRPSSRKAGNKIEDLRAIPWVFSWTQSRHIITGFYSIGSALNKYIEKDPDNNLRTLRDMYSRWKFFKSHIDNIQMILSKTDMKIAREYSYLTEPRETGEKIFNRIREEYELTRRIILDITEQKDILDNNPFLKRSIELRNPYMDSLSYIQIGLLRRLSGEGLSEEEKSTITDIIKLSINGISAGLKNTG